MAEISLKTTCKNYTQSSPTHLGTQKSNEPSKMKSLTASKKCNVDASLSTEIKKLQDDSTLEVPFEDSIGTICSIESMKRVSPGLYSFPDCKLISHFCAGLTRASIGSGIQDCKEVLYPLSNRSPNDLIISEHAGTTRSNVPVALDQQAKSLTAKQLDVIEKKFVAATSLDRIQVKKERTCSFSNLSLISQQSQYLDEEYLGDSFDD